MKNFILLFCTSAMHPLIAMSDQIPSLKELCAKRYLTTLRSKDEISRDLPQEVREYVKGDFIAGKSFAIHDPRYKNILTKFLFEPWGHKFRRMRETPISRSVETFSFIDVNKQGLLAVATDSGTVCVWDLLKSKKMLTSFKNSSNSIHCLQLSSTKGSNNLFIGSYNSLTIYSEFENDHYKTVKKINEGCDKIALSADEQLAAGVRRHHLIVYDIPKNGVLCKKYFDPWEEIIASVQFVYPESTLLIATKACIYKLIIGKDSDSCQMIDKFSLQPQVEHISMHGLQLDPSCKIVVYEAYGMHKEEEKYINVCDGMKGSLEKNVDKLLYKWPKHISTFKFNQTGSLLASIDYDGNIAICNMTRDKEKLTAVIKRDDYCKGYSICENGSSNDIAFIPLEPIDRYLAVSFDEYVFILDLWKYY